MNTRRVLVRSALLGGTLGLVAIFAGILRAVSTGVAGTSSLLMVFGGAGLLSLMGLVVFRPGPDRVEIARRAGASPRSIERQLAALRRMRTSCWLALVLAVLGAIVSVLVTR